MNTTRPGNESGFSVIEMLVSFAILSIAILGANTQYLMQLQQNGALKQQIQANALLSSTLKLVSSNPTLFAPLRTGAAALTETYIGCYNLDGSPAPNTFDSTTGFLLYDGGLDASTTAGQVALTEPIGNYCDIPRGSFEVHVSWVHKALGTPHNGQVLITVVTRPSVGQGFKSPRFAPSVWVQP